MSQLLEPSHLGAWTAMHKHSWEQAEGNRWSEREQCGDKYQVAPIRGGRHEKQWIWRKGWTSGAIRGGGGNGTKERREEIRGAEEDERDEWRQWKWMDGSEHVRKLICSLLLLWNVRYPIIKVHRLCVSTQSNERGLSDLGRSGHGQLECVGSWKTEVHVSGHSYVEVTQMTTKQT